MSLDIYLTRPVEGTHSWQLFDGNITHNLGTMASHLGIYDHLWSPDLIGITKAEQLILPLGLAISRMESEPDYYKQFNAKNGWGRYENLLTFLKTLLYECNIYPEADVSSYS